MRPRADRRIAPLDRCEADSVQSLLLGVPEGPAVRHVLLRVPPGKGMAARRALRDACDLSFGIRDGASGPTCSVGFSYAGLDALGLPRGYLRVFQRLAPSFRTGAGRRSPELGDGGASSAANWHPSFGQDRAHVVVSWHGDPQRVDAAVETLRARWLALRPAGEAASSGEGLTVHSGERLGAPAGEIGQWTHFGFRDDVSEVVIDRVPRRRAAVDLRLHAPGALLLGWQDDEGLNGFSLPQAPEKVRRFFRSASFGVLRMMAQDVAAFDAQVALWQQGIAGVFGPGGEGRSGVHPDFVKAKLCGRWPDGRALRPGATHPPSTGDAADYALDLVGADAAGRFTTGDAFGTGCPFASHVRRMQARPDDQGHLLVRPLLRRSVPFGPPSFGGAPNATASRGQYGHFFCASIENQFEHLLGQWGAHPPVGSAAADDARDPLMGPHDDPDSGLSIALEGKAAQRLTGFRRWTTTLGMAYAWYPGSEGLAMLFSDDFVPEELAGPWR